MRLPFNPFGLSRKPLPTMKINAWLDIDEEKPVLDRVSLDVVLPEDNADFMVNAVNVVRIKMPNGDIHVYKDPEVWHGPYLASSALNGCCGLTPRVFRGPVRKS